MKIVLTRVKKASITVDNSIVGHIDVGYLLLVGFTHDDSKEICAKMAEKVTNLRIMEDEQGKMNRSLDETNGELLVVPQFTLYADVSGRRPGFTDAAKPVIANDLFEIFIAELKKLHGNIQQGVFGANMQVESINDGPVTLILEL
jgi:D-aminoacyl-tRNA deacylase